MMMTEEQAKQKWCPMVRAADNTSDNNSANASASVDGDGRNPPYARCIGSNCMMWRQDTGQNVGECGLTMPAIATKP